MKNPHYTGPAPEVEEPKEIDIAHDRVRDYLKNAPHVEEFDVVKLRRLHPALENDKTWQEVRRRLEQSEGESETPSRKSKSR